MKNIFAKFMAVVVVASFAVAGLALPVNATSSSSTSAGELSLGGGAGAAKTSDQQDSLFGGDGIFTKIVQVLLFLIGAISVIMLIYGGIQYTLSAGDSGKVTNAKNTILYAIVGIVVAILSFAIVNFVIGNLSANGQ